MPRFPMPRPNRNVPYTLQRDSLPPEHQPRALRPLPAVTKGTTPPMQETPIQHFLRTEELPESELANTLACDCDPQDTNEVFVRTYALTKKHNNPDVIAFLEQHQHSEIVPWIIYQAWLYTSNLLSPLKVHRLLRDVERPEPPTPETHFLIKWAETALRYRVLAEPLEAVDDIGELFEESAEHGYTGADRDLASLILDAAVEQTTDPVGDRAEPIMARWYGRVAHIIRTADPDSVYTELSLLKGWEFDHPKHTHPEDGR